MNNEVILNEQPGGSQSPLRRFWNKIYGRFLDSLHNKNYCYLSFAIPIVIIYITFACMGMYPFGNKAILTLDMDGQYVYFFEQIRDVYTGQASLFYTFERCLGGEFLGYFTYYVASPITLIVVLFPKAMITEAIMTIMILKTGLSGLTFSIYLGKTREKNTVGFTMFSVMYALCSYATMYQFNTMWMDALIWLPLIALGVESLVKQGRFKLFIISLAMAICSNYYIGYMLCIFVAIYFFFCLFSIPKDEINPLNEAAHRRKSFLRIIVASAVALMMSAAIILSAYYALKFGKSTYQNNTYEASLRFDLLHFISKLYVGSFDTVRFAGTPNIYSGLLTILMLPSFYVSKKVKPSEKIFFTALVLLFVISFSVNTLDIMWHGFQVPIWFNYRYSFIFSFILLIMAYRGYENYKELSLPVFGKTVIVLIALLAVIQKNVTLARYEWVDGDWAQIDVKPGLGMLWLSIIFILAYLLIFYLGKIKQGSRVLPVVLAMVVFIEAFANSAINWAGELKDGGCATRENYRSYVDKMELASIELQKTDPTFYRTERTIIRKSNDNFASDLNGLSEFTSTFNASNVSFMKRLGFYTSEPTISYISGNPVSDSLLSVKYIIGSGDEDTNGSLPELNSVSSYYTHYTTENGLVIYENPYVLPIAYKVDKNFSSTLAENDFFDGDKSPFKYMNNLVSSMLGESTEVFKVCSYTTNKGSLSQIDPADKEGGISFRKWSSDSSAHFRFNITAEYDGNVYMYLPSPYTTAAKLSLNGKTLYTNFFQGETQRIIDLGTYEAGDKLTVELEFSHYRLYLWDTQDYFVQVNEEALKHATDTLKAQGLQIESFSDTKITGTVRSDSDGVVFTSIPYDTNWQVYVDGDRVETYELADAMLGFDIPSGEHSVKLVYVHKPFIIGAVIGVFGIGIFVLLCFLDKKYRPYYSCVQESKELCQEEERAYDNVYANTKEELSEENNDISS